MPLNDFERLGLEIQKMVLGHGQNVEKLCIDTFGLNPETMKPNKSPFTLYREINPNDPDAKLGYITLIQLMLKTQVFSPLRTIARMCGFKLVKLHVAPDQPTAMHEDAQDVEILGERNKAMLEGAHPDEVDAMTSDASENLWETAVKYREEWEAGVR